MTVDKSSENGCHQPDGRENTEKRMLAHGGMWINLSIRNRTENHQQSFQFCQVLSTEKIYLISSLFTMVEHRV